ncbi:MAG: TRAP transporter substrate-binding protein DctP [Syntrophorhabdaceae bacterium]|nr:TRAP transporter substrate-binding protein DctP [Syntrophorhabdaceae bacterium]
MKRIFIGLIVLLSIMIITSIQNHGYVNAAETFTIKAVTAFPKTAPDNIPFTIWVEEVEKLVAKRAPGELKIQWVGGPEAVKIPDQVGAVQRGMVDVCYTANAFYVSLLAEVDAMKLSDFTPMEERARGVMDFWNDLHEKRLGIHFLGRLGHDQKFYLYMLKPIKSADLTGFNIRVSPMYLQVVKGLGGNPVVIPITDLYVALERKVVDGYCMVTVGIRDYGWHKHTKYIVDVPFYRGPNPIMINLNTWKKLPKKLQDILTEATIEAEKRAVAKFEELQREERPLLLKEGIQVITLPPAEKEKFLRVAYEEGWKDVIQKSPQYGPELKKLLSKGK